MYQTRRCTYKHSGLFWGSFGTLCWSTVNTKLIITVITVILFAPAISVFFTFACLQQTKRRDMYCSASFGFIRWSARFSKPNWIKDTLYNVIISWTVYLKWCLDSEFVDNMHTLRPLDVHCSCFSIFWASRNYSWVLEDNRFQCQTIVTTLRSINVVLFHCVLGHTLNCQYVTPMLDSATDDIT